MLNLLRKHWITFCMVGIACFLGVQIWQLWQSTVMPDVPGIKWAKYKEVAAICYLPDCGCGITAEELVRAAEANHIKTVVLTEKDMPELKQLKGDFPDTQIIDHVPPKLMHKLAVLNKTEVLLIKNGHIVRSANGEFDFDLFFHRNAYAK